MSKPDGGVRLSTELLTGPISWMARNTVAANLLMVVVLMLGLAGVLSIKQEVFPDFELDLVTVAVPYPGASPNEVEQGIILAIEEEVRGLNGVKRVSSSAAEGIGTVAVELMLGEDNNAILADVKAAVDRIATFPEDAEKPMVSLASGRREVVSLVLSGDQSLSSLHELAEDVRRRLLADERVTQAELFGVPPLEVSIEVSRAQLEAMGLSLDDVSRQITLASLELPGGEVESRGGEFLVRVSDRKRTAQDFADIVVRGTASGGKVLLSDIATIRDAYQDIDLAYFFEGNPAVRLTAYRVGDETPASVAQAARDLAEVLRAEVPSTVAVNIWKDDSVMLDERISLLVRNGVMGLALVVLVLALFLDLRLAFWVALGIPLSFAGAFILAPMWGVSINMVSLFALIVVLGLVVDDAIVVGENIYELEQQGRSRIEASIEGARQMSIPVTFAVLTSVAAFAPLLFVPGFMGKIFGIIPVIVISVLLFSLLEGFFILPAHLGHAPNPNPSRLVKGLQWAVSRTHAPVRKWFAERLQRFTDGPYHDLVRALVAARYTTLALATASLIFTIGLLQAQIVPFAFFPKLEANNVSVNVRLPYGSPEAAALRVRGVLERELDQTIAAFGGPEAVQGVMTYVGEAQSGGGPGGGQLESGAHLLSIAVELVATSQRSFTAKEFADDWQARVPPLAGVDALSFISSAGPGAGAAVDVQLSHSDPNVLAQASGRVADVLRGYADLKEVENTYASGKPQLDFTLLPNARTLGLTATDVARQLRASFFGSEALREQRGRNELRVMVRLPESERGSEFDVEQLRIKTPTGGFVPLGSVARFERSRAPTTIERESGQRIVNVRAELAASARSSQNVVSDLGASVFPELLGQYPGLEVELVGEQRDQAESLGSLGSNFLVALFVMYALLAIPFKSYIQPVIIMSAIPFGIVGAVGGHYVMGYELSVISMMGIIALSGVVVNDSLVLIDSANEYRREGLGAVEAVVRAGRRRMRPILLTSLTTFFGLMPMIRETSPQARFLIPMAISLGFGVLFATIIVLLLVPALYVIVEDLVAAKSRVMHWVTGGEAPRASQPVSK
ncbi:MAG: hypothetical protein CL927_17440 [Deltaproteobacteria bacterium]|nr:hypothetical protein [Deltaproteobacteria bacterium]HCH62949.1 AcrB/AcrD/AcrF family protein [Deltaproteobacteria bacterium]